MVFDWDEAEAQHKLQACEVSALQQQGIIAGTPTKVVEQLGRLSDMGVQRVMLQWLDLDNLAGLEAFASAVLPQV